MIVADVGSPTSPPQDGQPEDDERIAIKKVLQDPNYKVRRLHFVQSDDLSRRGNIGA